MTLGLLPFMTVNPESNTLFVVKLLDWLKILSSKIIVAKKYL